MSMHDADREAAAALQEVTQNVQAKLDAQAAIFVCDFCGQPIEGAFYTWVTELPMTGRATLIDTETLGTASTALGFDEQWAACLTCDPVVALRDPEALATHVLDVRKELIPKALVPAIQHDILDLYNQFFRCALQRREDFR